MAGAAGGIRWGRALLGALLIEVLLALVAAAVFGLSTDPGPQLDALVPPVSFIAGLAVVAWLFRKSDRPIANGVVTGLMCALLYVLLGVGAYLVAPERVDMSQSLGLPYLASHGLKILGGAAGGWWIERKRTAPA